MDTEASRLFTTSPCYTTTFSGLPNILILTLYWRKRALPLVWQVLSHPGNSGYADWVTLLHHVATLLPPNAQVVGLADREFGSADLMALIRWHGWDYCLRVRGDQLIWHEPTQQWRPCTT